MFQDRTPSPDEQLDECNWIQIHLQFEKETVLTTSCMISSLVLCWTGGGESDLGAGFGVTGVGVGVVESNRDFLGLMALSSGSFSASDSSESVSFNNKIKVHFTNPPKLVLIWLLEITKPNLNI